MKKIFLAILAIALAFAGCKRSAVDDLSMGYLSFTGTEILVDPEVKTKAASEADGNYTIKIFDGTDQLVVSTTYGQVIANGGRMSLPAGSYRLEACSSSSEIPAAAFERPVYGASKEFEIVSSQVTEIGTLTCTLLQAKVTVSYNDEFLKMVTGDGTATVSVNSSSPLSYGLNYNGGTPSYEQAAGYFAVNNGASTTMTVTFKGSIDGKSQKMSKAFTGIEPRTWHQIKFVKKEDTEGQVSFMISIDDFVSDVELKTDIDGGEEIIGDDPQAPQGDGGIELQSTCSYDISEPVVVPAAGSPFVLTMKAVVPNKVKRFTVEVNSTSEVFVGAVGDINNGSNVLDLVNPSDGARAVFSEILPFPYGDKVNNMTEISFDLSDAQTPLLAFSGTHTFVMHVTDQAGCKKDISIDLVVE